MRATDKLYHNTSCEIHGSNVQSSIVPTDCGDIHVPCCAFGRALSKKYSLLGFLAVVERTLHEQSVWEQLACVAYISTVQLHANIAEH